MIAGELKKLLTGPTGLHHEDQKLIYKDKERDSKAFLDVVGVKDKSKLVLVEDPISQEKRLLEMRKNAKLEKASKSISEISLEVDRLAGQVTFPPPLFRPHPLNVCVCVSVFFFFGFFFLGYC